jgi:hypothetical protein
VGITLQTTPVTVTSGTGSGTVVGTAVPGFRRFDYFMFDASLTNTDTGTVDVYVQRCITVGSTTTWRDWIHFPQLTASVGAKEYSITSQSPGGIHAIGTGSSPALAANTAIGGHPGDQLRLVVVTGGTGVLLAQDQTVNVTGWQDVM